MEANMGLANKTLLISLIMMVQEDLADCIAGLSPQQLNSPGSLESWSIKNMIAHITFWIKHASLSLEAIHGGVPPSEYADVNQINDEVILRHQNEPWSEVKKDMELTFEQILEQITAADESDLVTPGRYPWLNGRSFFDQLIGVEAWHVEDHIAGYLLNEGAVDKATSIFRRWTEKMVEFPEYHNKAYYDLACLYAKTGQSASAVNALEKCLPASPELKAWAKKDPDLDSIRNDPKSIALGL
jgi:tetratricopeptide (TPR) repeat protein